MQNQSFQTNYSRHEVAGEKNNKPSATVPDQTMSLRELISRYARGLPINGVKIPVYDENPEDDNLPDPATLDLAEREELALQYAEELQELKERHKLKRKAEIDAKAKADKEAADKKEAAVEPVNAPAGIPAPSTNIT